MHAIQTCGDSPSEMTPPAMNAPTTPAMLMVQSSADVKSFSASTHVLHMKE